MVTRRELLSLFQTRVQRNQLNLSLNFVPIVEKLAQSGPLTFTLSESPFLPFIQIFLNGLLISEKIDYSIKGKELLLVDHYKGMEEYNLVAYYVRIQ